MLDSSKEYQAIPASRRVFAGHNELHPPPGKRFSWGDREEGTRLLAAVLTLDLLGVADDEVTAFLIDLLHSQERHRGWMFSVTVIGIFLARANLALYQKYRERFERLPETES